MSASASLPFLTPSEMKFDALFPAMKTADGPSDSAVYSSTVVIGVRRSTAPAACVYPSAER
jgi:hypothetical protein